MYLVVMGADSTIGEAGAVIKRIESSGLKPHLSDGKEHMMIGVAGPEDVVCGLGLASLPGVARVVRMTTPFKLASREFRPEKTVVRAGNIEIGGNELVVMAGPCAVESRDQLMETAIAVRDAGAKILRGGAYKPRTSPYSFQGLGPKGLELLREAGDATGLAVVTEVLSEEDLPLVAERADILQIGARNMQNFSLLEKVGKISKPVLLKRGMMSTIEELLQSAEYILMGGNPNVILCERGIRTFEKYTRNTLDIAAIPLIRRLSHLPIIADPSHASGDRLLVPPLAMAAVAAGADGLLIEVHPHPQEAKCDGAQSLLPAEFQKLMNHLHQLARTFRSRHGDVAPPEEFQGR